MPPHEHQNHTLREMDTLLQELNTLNNMNTSNESELDHLGMPNPFSYGKKVVQAAKAYSGMGDIGKAQTIWGDTKPGSDPRRKKILKETLEKIVAALDTWNDIHVRKFKDALYLDADIGPLWIQACMANPLTTQAPASQVPSE
jgi:hypothetical protein